MRIIRGVADGRRRQSANLLHWTGCQGEKRIPTDVGNMESFPLFLHSVPLFVLAGLCEIGGGWLIWQWLREGRPSGWEMVGALVLVLYGLIPTLHPAHFGRVCAVYGGFFIVLSLLWGWYFDGDQPDQWNVTGATIALIGVSIMMYWPR